MGDMILEARQVEFSYPHAPAAAVSGLDLTVGAGELVGVVGPNGGGKTTLLRLLLGALTPSRGQVAVLGRPTGEWDRRALARVVGVVAQREEPAFPIRARESVLLGRYPHLGPLGAARPGDHAVVDRALARCDASHLAARWVSTLSGGEWQRVRVARALAQEPRALVLDEPTANLDLRHEVELFDLVSELVKHQGLAGLIVTHHVNLAARFVDRILVLERGHPRASGPPREVLTQDVLERVFGCPLELVHWRGVPQLVPLRRGE
jgi:iron complex transport system ATP-binding protein